MHKHHQETIKCSSCVNGELNKNETYNEPVIAAGRQCGWPLCPLAMDCCLQQKDDSFRLKQCSDHAGRILTALPWEALFFYAIHSLTLHLLLAQLQDQEPLLFKPGNASASPIDLHAPCGKSAVKSLGDALTLWCITIRTEHSRSRWYINPDIAYRGSRSLLLNQYALFIQKYEMCQMRWINDNRCLLAIL